MNKNFLFGLCTALIFCFSVSAQGPGSQTARPLPEGNGKALVATACTTCHEATMITNAGHTRDDFSSFRHHRKAILRKNQEFVFVRNLYVLDFRLDG